jgi:hypothetical protein
MRFVLNYGPDAIGELRAMSNGQAYLLEAELRRLLGPATLTLRVRKLPIVHEPPWCSVDITRGYVAVLRILTEQEQPAAGPDEQQMLVAHMIPRRLLDAIVQRMIGQAVDGE